MIIISEENSYTAPTSINEVILLHPHFAATDYIGDDVLQGCVLVDAVCPLVDCHHIPVLLVQGPFSRLLEVWIDRVPKIKKKHMILFLTLFAITF